MVRFRRLVTPFPVYGAACVGVWCFVPPFPVLNLLSRRRLLYSNFLVPLPAGSVRSSASAAFLLCCHAAAVHGAACVAQFVGPRCCLPRGRRLARLVPLFGGARRPRGRDIACKLAKRALM